MGADPACTPVQGAPAQFATDAVGLWSEVTAGALFGLTRPCGSRPAADTAPSTNSSPRSYRRRPGPGRPSWTVQRWPRLTEAVFNRGGHLVVQGTG